MKGRMLEVVETLEERLARVERALKAREDPDS
jgi:hypothetical protein